jgi:hypothetical protein
MTISPAFLQEYDDQIRRASAELADARALGNEANATVAAARLEDLEELARRATDATLLAAPSWP